MPESITGTVTEGGGEATRGRRRGVTIDSIARQAGVTKTTVSRALNDRPDVDPLTRARITEIAEQLGTSRARPPRCSAPAAPTRWAWRGPPPGGRGSCAS